MTIDKLDWGDFTILSNNKQGYNTKNKTFEKLFDIEGDIIFKRPRITPITVY